MDEILDICTENGEKIGTISKKEYYSLKQKAPWIKCVTCFVIDEKNKKILFEKRGNTRNRCWKIGFMFRSCKIWRTPNICNDKRIIRRIGN